MKPEISEAEAQMWRALVCAMAWEAAANLTKLGIVGMVFWWVLT